MSENRPEPPADLGIYSRVNLREGFDPADKIAIAASGAWVVFCILFLIFVGLGDGQTLGPLRFLILVLAVVLPVALVWIAAIALKSARVVQEESERLQASMDAMRQIYIAQAQMAATTMGPNVERKIDEIVKGQKRAEDVLTNFVTTRNVPEEPEATRPLPIREAPAPAPLAESQPALALATPEDAIGDPVSVEDMIVAMNFPETVDDVAGFAALRRALQDRSVSPMIQASQDILTLLSQDGIYMDDLSPDRARPEVWRKFTEGERGRAISGLGGIRDRSSLALTSTRMRQDSIFRDTAHHFLRTFDKTLSSVASNLSDSEIILMAETRTARAFMLLGRVAGMFD